MGKSNKKKSGGESFFVGICIAIMLVVCALGFIVSIMEFTDFMNYRDGAKKVDSYVSKVETYYDGDDNLCYTLYVDYEINDKWYKDAKITNYSENRKIEDKIEILVREDMPYEVQTPTGGLFLIIFGMIVSPLIFVLLINVVNTNIRESINSKKQNKYNKNTNNVHHKKR